jgi:hypothetical protein
MTLPASSLPRTSRRAAWAVSALLLGAGTAAFTPPVRSLLVPGTTYTFSISTSESDESFSAAGKTLTRQVGKAQIAGDKARIDFAEVKGASPSPMMGKDGYVLLHEGGKVMYMVDPKKKEYLKMDVKELGSMFSSISNMAGGMMKIDVKDVSSSVRKVGAGETILGYPTEMWEIKQAYTMSVKAFGFGSTTKNEGTTTIWSAPSLRPDELMNPFLDMGRNIASMFEGNAEWEKMMAGPSNELPKAAALKMVGHQKSTSDKGKTQYSITNMEVTDWTKGDVPAANLELPKGYRMVELPNMAALSDSMKASGLDTLDLKASMKNAGYSDEDIAEAIKQAAVDGAKDQAKIEAREAGKNAVKAGIGGLLKRKKPF